MLFFSTFFFTFFLLFSTFFLFTKNTTHSYSGTQEHRWYDKTNFIVDQNGRASGNFEHSLYDGAAIRRLCDETWYVKHNKFIYSFNLVFDTCTDICILRK